MPSSDTNNSQSANQSRAQSPEDGDDYGGVDYNTLIPAIAMDCPSDSESKKDGFNNQSDGLESTLSNFESVRDFTGFDLIHFKTVILFCLDGPVCGHFHLQRQ